MLSFRKRSRGVPRGSGSAGGSAFRLSPILARDLERGIIDSAHALAVYQRTGWSQHIVRAPDMMLCRYEDNVSRAQPAWVATVRTDQPVPVPWYVPLEIEGELPAPPWQVSVIINACSGIRIVDHVTHVRGAGARRKQGSEWT